MTDYPDDDASNALAWCCAAFIAVMIAMLTVMLLAR